MLISCFPGSIPERDQDNKLYNTSTVYSRAGDLVAMHRESPRATLLCFCGQQLTCT